jgi:hypothetical protein
MGGSTALPFKHRSPEPAVEIPTHRPKQRSIQHPSPPPKKAGPGVPVLREPALQASAAMDGEAQPAPE